MSISIDPYRVLKDYLNGKKEKKFADELLNKYYRIQTNTENLVGKLLGLDKIGSDIVLAIESAEKKTRIPFKNIEGLTEVKSEEYEFPRKLDELLSISKSRKEKRPSYLNWVLSSAQPIRDSAAKWFHEEVSQIERQLKILVFLFPHRSFQEWDEYLTQVKDGFDKAIAELDRVLALVKSGRTTKITDIYREKQAFEPTKESPNILNAFMGVFSAGIQLDKLIENVENTILDIEDALAIARIQQYQMAGTRDRE